MNVQLACMWEVLSRKVGNVHPKASFKNTNYYDFLLSATAIAPVLEKPLASVGQLILDCVRTTQSVVQQNTNLGIILLLAPLAKAKSVNQIGRDLAQYTVEDSTQVFQAIREANPGGLGEAAEQDVHQAPTLPLHEVMKLAADRDLIARQYANGFHEVQMVGVPALVEGFELYHCVEAAVIHCQLTWLAEYPDSLIVRKVGLARAVEVQQAARQVLALGSLATPQGRAAGVQLDHFLRSDGHKLNPGTTADLVTACLFIALQDGKLCHNSPFFWTVSDWL